MTRPGGRMLLGVPMAHDEVQFNGARIYGPLQVMMNGSIFMFSKNYGSTLREEILN